MHKFANLCLNTSLIFSGCFALFSCSKPTHQPLFENNAASTLAEEVAPESMKITSSDTIMNCDEDHIQLGGVCHPGDSTSSYIEVSLTRDNAPITFGSGGSQTTKLDGIRCENGRFFVVVPRPNDPSATCSGGNCSPEYLVESQIFLSDDGLQWRAGAKGTRFPIRIQLLSSCTGV